MRLSVTVSSARVVAGAFERHLLGFMTSPRLQKAASPVAPVPGLALVRFASLMECTGSDVSALSRVPFRPLVEQLTNAAQGRPLSVRDSKRSRGHKRDRPRERWAPVARWLM